MVILFLMRCLRIHECTHFLSDILLAVNGEGAKLPQAVGRSPTTARLPDRSWDIYGLQLLAC